MSLDTSDTKDVPDATDAAQESVGATKPLNPAGMKAMQGGDVTGSPPVLPPDSQPATATTELGADIRDETSPEKPEVKLYHNTLDEKKEGRPAGPPEGWKPGGAERGG